MEQQTPRTHPSFWRSSAGVTTALIGGVAAVVGVIALYEKSSTAAPAAPAAPSSGGAPSTTSTGVVTGLTPGAYYLFQVNSTSNPASELQTAGFSNIQSQPDPTTMNNWIVTAQWASQATTVTPAGGWTVTGSMGAPLLSTPPGPATYSGANETTGAAESLIPGDWYSFAIATSFPSTTTAALAAVPAMLEQYGWNGALVTVAADASNSTWNVYAQWGGASSAATDGPPVWLLIPQRTIPNSSVVPAGPINLGSSMPVAHPPNTMPW